MIQKINGQLIFTYGCPKKEYNSKLNRYNFKLSLLGALIGIFLLPQLAYLSTITPEKLIELTNLERQTAGLKPLTANQLLTQAAIQKGKTILETNIFKHTVNDKKFSAWIRDAGYNYSYAGENLAIDFITSEGVIEAWKNSHLHKRNLLSPYYLETGLSTVTGKFQGQDTMVVVQIFGAPATASVAPWAVNSNAALLDSKLAGGEINLLEPRLQKAENLLSHAVISQELSPLENKFTLPVNNYLANQMNTFIILPAYRTALNNFLIIITFLMTVYLFIFLYTYYFSKVNKLVSAES